jgi:hypothetical protein
MKCYSLKHVANHVLLKDLDTDVTNDRDTTAWMLTRIAEVDARKLYLPAACSSMYDYCVRILRMSEDMAYKRIRVARAARQFPAIFPAVADGRLHLNAVLLLAPHLTPETAEDLLAAVADRTRSELELLIAERFPRPDLPTLVNPIQPVITMNERAPEPIADSDVQLAARPVVPSDGLNTTELMEPLLSHVASSPATRAKVASLSPGRFALQFTVDQATHDQLRYAQALLGHAVPTGEVAEVIRRALDALVQKLELQKFAKSARSRPRRSAAKGRYIPATIRRAIWERDGGQCTFVAEDGTRCASTRRLEFDHMDPVARGGQTTADRVRLRCRPHNQCAADCTFGAEFMRRKREQSKHEFVRGKKIVPAEAAVGAARESASENDVIR